MTLIGGFCHQLHPPNLRPREGVPGGQRAWGGPSPLPSLACVIVQGARRADTLGGPVGTQGWGPGSRPALLASPPVLQPNQEGVKHIKDPLNIFIGSVSGALNQILFFKSIWANGLKQGLDQRSADGRRGAADAVKILPRIAGVVAQRAGGGESVRLKVGTGFSLTL